MRIGEVGVKEMVMKERTETEKSENKTISHNKETMIVGNKIMNKISIIPMKITTDNNNKDNP